MAGKGINRPGERIVRADYGNKKGQGIVKQVLEIKWVFDAASSFSNFEIQKYYQNDPGLNGVYSRDNLPKIKDRAYIINFDEYSYIGTHWIALFVPNENITCFDSFEVEHIPKEI